MLNNDIHSVTGDKLSQASFNLRSLEAYDLRITRSTELTVRTKLPQNNDPNLLQNETTSRFGL